MDKRTYTRARVRNRKLWRAHLKQASWGRGQKRLIWCFTEIHRARTRQPSVYDLLLSN